MHGKTIMETRTERKRASAMNAELTRGCLHRTYRRQATRSSRLCHSFRPHGLLELDICTERLFEFYFEFFFIFRPIFGGGGGGLSFAGSGTRGRENGNGQYAGRCSGCCRGGFASTNSPGRSTNLQSPSDTAKISVYDVSNVPKLRTYELSQGSKYLL